MSMEGQEAMRLTSRQALLCLVVGLVVGCGTDSPSVAEPTAALTTSTADFTTSTRVTTTTSIQTSTTTTTALPKTTSANPEQATSGTSKRTTAPRVTTTTHPLIPAELIEPEDGRSFLFVMKSNAPVIPPQYYLEWVPSPHAVSESVELLGCSVCYVTSSEPFYIGFSKYWSGILSWRVVSEYADGRTIASETWSLTVDMYGFYQVGGQVVDAVTGDPVEGARAAWVDELGPKSTTTNGEGTFSGDVNYNVNSEFPPTTITIDANGYESQQIVVERHSGRAHVQLQPTTP